MFVMTALMTQYGIKEQYRVDEPFITEQDISQTEQGDASQTQL